MSKRTIIAKIELDEDTMLRNFEINGAEVMDALEYLEHEFGWIAESGFTLTSARIIDEDNGYNQKYLTA